MLILQYQGTFPTPNYGSKGTANGQYNRKLNYFGIYVVMQEMLLIRKDPAWRIDTVVA